MNTPNTQTIFDFTKESSLKDWRIVDDVVMGGVSDGKLTLDRSGNGKYFGSVSTANNGGFSSVRYRFNKMAVDSNSQIVLRVKGDGKKFQLRVKDKRQNYYSYVQYFQTADNSEATPTLHELFVFEKCLLV